MPLRVPCACGQWLQVPDEFVGKTIRCPTCKAVTAAPPWVQLRQVEGVTVARLPWPELGDEDLVEGTGKALLRLVESGCRSLVLDLGEVEMMGSPMLGKLIAVHKKLREVGGRLAAYNLNMQLRGIFGMLHLDKLFAVRDSEAEAVRDVQEAAARAASGNGVQGARGETGSLPR